MAKIHRLLPLLLLSVGCDKLFAKDTPAPTAEESDAPKAAASAKADHGDHGDHAKEEGGRFGVPFAWESSPEEPLAKARSFMAEVLKANEAFMGQGHDHFKPFADAETPRATVLTCADSRVQAAAWDQNPENDDYTVRNLGNQLSTSLGSVQYGVDQLHTPVLLIIGHTGCDAVKAALQKDAKAKGPIADEIARIELPAPRKSKDFNVTWKNAVVANVNRQVEQAVAQFGNHVQAGDLTVVGAVYDFRDDLDDGHGRLHIVNVNSNVEEARLAAFEEAVQEVNKKAAAAASPFGKRTFRAPAALPFEQGQPLSPGARASVNALNMLASGSFPGLRPGMAIPGTVDLKAAPSFRPSTPAHGAHGAGEHGGHDDAEQGAGSEHGGAGHGKPAVAHGGTPKRKAPAAHAAPAAEASHDDAAGDSETGHAEAAAPDSHDEAANERPHAPAKTQPAAARAAAAPTGHAPARVAGQSPAPSSTAAHGAASAAGRVNPPASTAPVASARPTAPRSGPPVSRPLGPMTGAPLSPIAGARAPAPRSGPPVSRPLTPATPYPGAPVAGAPAASRQATPAPAVAPGRPAAAPAPTARSAPAASQARTPAAPVRPAASTAPGAPRPTTPQAGQGRAPAPGNTAPAAGAAPRQPAPARAPAPTRGAAPAAAKAPAAAPGTRAAPAPVQGQQAAPAKPAPPAAPKQPARPRLPMPGPVTAGPTGPESEDAPPDRQKAPAAARAKAPAPTAPAKAAPAPAKAPAAPPQKH